MNKDTNPKDTLGIKKVPMHSVPCGPLLELGLAMMEGGRKYGSHNYREAGCRASVYYDAIERHIKAWWEGEDIDPDSGLHHLIKAMACCAVMRDSMLMKNWIDDRPIRYPDGLDIDGYNKQVAELINRYPDCKEPFTEKGRKYPKPLINKLKQFEATIECVPAYGWRIRLANGKFLMPFKGLTRETSTPFYYSTEPKAEMWLDRYLRG